MVARCRSGAEAWEVLAANGAIPLRWLREDGRRFVTSASRARRLCASDSELVMLGGANGATGTVVPQTVALALAMATSAEDVLAAESLAADIATRACAASPDAVPPTPHRALWGGWRESSRLGLSAATARFMRNYNKLWCFDAASGAVIEGLSIDAISAVRAAMVRAPDHRSMAPLSSLLQRSGLSIVDANGLACWCLQSSRWSHLLEVLRGLADGEGDVRWTAVYPADGARPLLTNAMALTRAQLVDPFEPLIALWSLGFTLLAEGGGWVYLGVPLRLSQPGDGQRSG